MKNSIKISALLTDLYKNPEFQEDLTIGKLLDLLGGQAYGIGLLIFAIPSLLPISAIPGIATIFGSIILLFSLQMVFLLKQPWLPQWLRAKKLNSAVFASFLQQAIPYIERCEKYIKPRYSFFITPVTQSFIGIILVLVSALLMLPIPLSNMPLSALIAIIALGLIGSDGLTLLVGCIASIMFIFFYSEVIHWFIEWIIKLFN